MNLLRPLVTACCLLLTATLPAPASADSSSVSSASGSGSQSIGSVSDSIQGSSNSSTGRRVAAGPYRVTEIVAVAERPGLERLTLAGEPDGETFGLLLPVAVREQAALQPGARIAVSAPAYGLAFTRDGDAAPFFLALDEAWRHEFKRQAVTP